MFAGVVGAERSVDPSMNAHDTTLFSRRRKGDQKFLYLRPYYIDILSDRFPSGMLPIAKVPLNDIIIATGNGELTLRKYWAEHYVTPAIWEAINDLYTEVGNLSPEISQFHHDFPDSMEAETLMDYIRFFANQDGINRDYGFDDIRTILEGYCTSEPVDIHMSVFFRNDLKALIKRDFMQSTSLKSYLHVEEDNHE